MSPKKKPAPNAKSATKDELINSLFDSESEGPAARQSNDKPTSKAAENRAQPPPPPPVIRNENDRIYDFEADETRSLPAESDVEVYDASKDNTPLPPDIENRTLSIVRNPPDENPLQLEELKTVVHSVEQDVSQSGHEQNRKSKLEEVLRRLRPQISQHPQSQQNPIDNIVPPPVKPVGVVAKAIYSGTNPNGDERAPTEPVRDSTDDEKTVAQKPAKPGFFSRAFGQDVKTEPITTRPSLDGPEADPEAEQFMPTEIRPNSPGARFREEVRNVQPGAAIFSSAEAALRQSENLRVAQKRISDLENELERVRRENESLRSAGETLRRRMDELQSQAENAELNTQEAKKIAEEERKVLKGQIQSRDRELAEMKSRIDDAENRLEANFRKIRVRERDLEHRIEIIKAESQSITASKDRMILELKRQIDQISSELNHAKLQVQETFGQFKEKQETARRAVRALRIALTVLEGEDDSGSRKAE